MPPRFPVARCARVTLAHLKPGTTLCYRPVLEARRYRRTERRRGSGGRAVRRKVRIVLAIFVTLSAGLIATPVAFAGNCPSPCVGMSLVDNESSSQSASVNSVSGTKVLHGTWGWSFGMTNGTMAATNASLSVESGYPASDFVGVTSFPVSTSAATFGPGQSLGVNLNSTIGASFSAGFNSSRAMTPTVIPAKGGKQSVKVTFTRTSTSECTNGCDLQGGVSPGLAGAKILGLTRPSNLNQGELFSSTVSASGAQWDLNGPILNKKYAVTVQISLPKEGTSYHYKPEVDLSMGFPGGHGCGSQGGDTCVGPTNMVTLPDATLDGPTPGAGQITFSVDQAFIWDEGGPPLQTDVNYGAMFP
jgi:hypothetical protein